MALAPNILARLKAITGAGGWVSEPNDLAPYLSEPRGRFHGQTPLLLLPASTDQVAAIVSECADQHIPIVPQGGNTGLVGGQIPSSSVSDQIIVNLGRMNRIRDIDPVAGTMTAEAGCILAAVQTAAIAVDRLFPLSLAAEGSCQIGGNLATNAGGTQVLRYGTARALTLGLEVVLADGKVWDGLKRLGKDNTGYDLKHMFIGSEGTLGIITAAVLRLFPQPRQTVTAFAAINGIAAGMKLLERMQSAGGERTTAFELMSDLALELAITHMDGVSNPLAAQAPWYVLMEFHGGAGDDLEPTIESMLGQALDDGEVVDGAIAQNAGQAQAMWKLRESIPPAQSKEGASIKNDVGVPGHRAAEFVEACTTAIEAVVPGSKLVAFGHLGDGNLHMNVSQPPGMDPRAYLDHWDEMTGVVHDLAMEFGGTFSAEHGIGQLKRGELKRHKSAAEFEAMVGIKAALDPQGIFNPGKIF
jgi:D-lactate dehydrogenase (cytochrome)